MQAAVFSLSPSRGCPEEKAGEGRSGAGVRAVALSPVARYHVRALAIAPRESSSDFTRSAILG